MTSKKNKNNKSYWVEDTPEKLDYINQNLYKENMKLKDKLTKYKRGFKILKEKTGLEIKKVNNLGRILYKLYYGDDESTLEQEEYELLEELMKDE